MFAFDYKGVVIVPKDSIPVEELAIEVVIECSLHICDITTTFQR